MPTLGGQNLVSGRAFALDDLRGSRVVLSFWASWCSACRGQLNSIATSLKGNDLVVVGVNLDENEADMITFLNGRHIFDYEVFGGGWLGGWAKHFRVYRHGIPWDVLIDPDGRILAQGTLDQIRSVLANEPLPRERPSSQRLRSPEVPPFQFPTTFSRRPVPGQVTFISRKLRDFQWVTPSESRNSQGMRVSSRWPALSFRRDDDQQLVGPLDLVVNESLFSEPL